MELPKIHAATAHLSLLAGVEINLL